MMGLLKKDNITGPNLDYGDTSGTAKETYFFPELKNDLNKATVATNYTIDGLNFFGIYCSKEACVGLYNAMAQFLNRQAIYRSSGIKGPLGMIAESLDYLSKTTLVGMALMNAAKEMIASIVGAMSKVMQTFCSLFTSGGPIATAIGIVIALLATACVAIFGAMLFFGSKEKGFAVGWKIKNIITREWVCTTLD